MSEDQNINVKNLAVSTGPHIYTVTDTPRIMYGVILALIPASAMGVYIFGWSALKVIVVSMLAAILTEGAVQLAMGRQVSMLDGSAALTGLLLALNLPPGSPWWMVLVGSVVAITIGKQIYGGLGHNPFNPALVARVVILVSWPVQMTRWIAPRLMASSLDAVSAATPSNGVTFVILVPMVFTIRQPPIMVPKAMAE